MNIKKIVGDAIKEYETKFNIKSAKKLFKIDQAPNANNTSYKILVTTLEDAMVQGEEEVAKNLYNMEYSLKNFLNTQGLPSTVEKVNADSFRVTVDTTSLKESTIKLLNGLKDGSKTILGLNEATIQIIISDIEGLEDDDEMYDCFANSEYADSYDYTDYEDDLNFEVAELGDISWDEEDETEVAVMEDEDDVLYDVYPIDSRDEEIIPYYAKVVAYNTVNEEPHFVAVNTDPGDEGEKLKATIEELLQVLGHGDSYAEQLEGTEAETVYSLFKPGATMFTYTDPSNNTWFFDEEALATENRAADMGLDESKEVTVFTESDSKKFTMSAPSTVKELFEVLDVQLNESQSLFDATKSLVSSASPVILIGESGTCTVHDNEKACDFLLSEEEISTKNDIQHLINCVAKGKVLEGKRVLQKIFVNKYNKRDESIVDNLK